MRNGNGDKPNARHPFALEWPHAHSFKNPIKSYIILIDTSSSTNLMVVVQ